MPLPLLGIAAAVSAIGIAYAAFSDDDDDDDDHGSESDAKALRERQAARDRKRKKQRLVQWMAKSLQHLAERHSATGRRAINAESQRDLAEHYLAPGRRPDRLFGLPTQVIGFSNLPTTKTRTADPREVLDRFLPKDGPTDTEKELEDLERNVAALKGLKKFIAVQAGAPNSPGADADQGDKRG